MFMVFKKKQMIMTALVLMLGIAGYLNYRYDKDEAATVASMDAVDPAEPGVGETVMVSSDAVKDKKDDKTAKQKTDSEVKEDFFAAERLKRDKARAKTREDLERTLADESASAELRSELERKLSNLARFEENETIAENLLSAKGFKQTLVYITDESVNVTVKQSGISRSDTAKIVDIIFELTQNNNVKIVEVN